TPEAAGTALDALVAAGMAEWVPTGQEGRPSRKLRLSSDTTCFKSYESDEGDGLRDPDGGDTTVVPPPPPNPKEPERNVASEACSPSPKAPSDPLPPREEVGGGLSPSAAPPGEEAPPPERGAHGDGEQGDGEEVRLV